MTREPRARLKTSGALERTASETLDRADAQLIAYLDTHDFRDSKTTGIVLKKWEYARAALMTRTQATASSEDPMRRFMETFMDRESSKDARESRRARAEAREQARAEAPPAREVDPLDDWTEDRITFAEEETRG